MTQKTTENRVFLPPIDRQKGLIGTMNLSTFTHWVISKLSYALCLGTLVAGCSDGGVSGAAGGAGGTGAGGAAAVVNTQPQEPNYRPCSRQTKVGEFAVAMKTIDGTPFTVFQGSVFDSVNPLDALDEVANSGVCRLLNRKIRQCSPACTADKPVCGGGGGCVAFPVQKNLGTVSVVGVNDGIVTTPSAKNFYSNDGIITYPGVVEGSEVTLTTSGGDLPPFQLMTKGIAPLEMTTKTPTVKKGEGVNLAWKSPRLATGARLHIVVSLDNHGTTPQQIECDAPDTGSFEIPATLVDSLTNLGVSGFPSMFVTRRSVESKSIAAGCVEFNITAADVLDVVVDGLKSCTKNEDCPSGQKCQGNLTCK